MTLILDVPDNTAWSRHLRCRLDLAHAIAMYSSDEKSQATKAKLIAPDGVGSQTLLNYGPDAPLRELQGIRPEIRPGWQIRRDLISESAAIICDIYGAGAATWLYCEAGYANIGDPVLSAYTHIVRNGRPIIVSQVTSHSHKNIDRILRLGRAAKIIGTITGQRPAILAASDAPLRGKLVFDVFDSDSIMIVDSIGIA